MHATVQNGGARNRLDENKGTFGSFVAGQKDEENSLLYADRQLIFYRYGSRPVSFIIFIVLYVYLDYLLQEIRAKTFYVFPGR